MERLEYCRVPGMPGVEALLAERGAVTRWTYRGKLHASHAEGLMLMEPRRGARQSAPRQPAAGQAGRFPCTVHFAGPHRVRRGRPRRRRPESRLAHGIRLLLTHCTEKPAPAAKRPSRAVLVRARDALRQRYAQTVSLGELAALTGLSRYHPRAGGEGAPPARARHFKRIFHVTPGRYQLSARGGSSP